MDPRAAAGLGGEVPAGDEGGGGVDLPRCAFGPGRLRDPPGVDPMELVPDVDSDSLRAHGAVPPIPPMVHPRPALKKNHTRIDVPGGYLVLRPGWIDAHCECVDHRLGDRECKADSTTTPTGATSIYGRKAAFLMAWLAFGQECTTRDMHRNAAGWPSKRSKLAEKAMSLGERIKWREWLRKHRPEVLAHERPLRAVALEPEEQPNL